MYHLTKRRLFKIFGLNKVRRKKILMTERTAFSVIIYTHTAKGSGIAQTTRK